MILFYFLMSVILCTQRFDETYLKVVENKIKFLFLSTFSFLCMFFFPYVYFFLKAIIDFFHMLLMTVGCLRGLYENLSPLGAQATQTGTQ